MKLGNGTIIQQDYYLNADLATQNPYLPDNIIVYGYDDSGGARINNIAKIGPGFWNDLPAIFQSSSGVVPVFMTSVTHPTIVKTSSGGSIEIADWQTGFNTLIPGNMVSANISVLFGSNWFDRSSTVPDQTRGGSDELLTSNWILNESTNPDKILVRLL